MRNDLYIAFTEKRPAIARTDGVKKTSSHAESVTNGA